MDCVKSENYARQRDLASNDKACIKRKYESNKKPTSVVYSENDEALVSRYQISKNANYLNGPKK